ncbi:hypothetical protein NFI96_003538 [Prochilodus magdalenae]|nr:hypothetical protein NFI96_003538 [Prochilodus magdalenae]
MIHHPHHTCSVVVLGVLTIEEQGNTVHRETDGLQSGPVHLQSVLYECLYTFPCQWNYRPDHCMYGSNCKGAEEEGVSILHGNRGVYHDDKQPAFKVVYDAIHDYPFGENVFQSLFYPLQTKFLDTVNTLCGRIPQVFLKQIEKTMKAVFEQKVVRHARAPHRQRR